VASTVTTITDLTPKVQTTAAAPTSVGLTYTLAGVESGTESARVTSNVLTVSLDPATVTPTASYPTQDSYATLNVSWTPNAARGDPDFWQVYIGTGAIGSRLPGSARSTSFAASLSRGFQYNIRVVPFVTLSDGSVVQAGNSSAALNLNVTPGIPRSLNLYASGISNLCLTFAGPATGTATNYILERYNASTGPWVA